MASNKNPPKESSCVPNKDHLQEKITKKNAWRKKIRQPRVAGPPFVLQEPASVYVQFQSFLNQVLLTQEECSVTTSRILHDLEPCLTQAFGRCCPYIFGSMYTGLALVGSDVDIYLDTGLYNVLPTLPDPKPELKRVVKRCSRALRTDRRFSHIVPISEARVPIVKLMHNPTGISCDISFKDPLGVHNSRLLRFYLLLHRRFFEVMVAIKFWAKKYGLCNADGISSYGWTLLFIFFLQTRKLPNGNCLVPSVHELQRDFCPLPGSLINGWRADFHPRENFVVLPDEPQFSHHGFLSGFFNYYKSFSFEDNIISPFLGQPLPWSSLDSNKPDPLPPELQCYQRQLISALSDKATTGNHHIVSIQDPFQHDYVLGASCSRKRFENVVTCLNAAARICQLEEQLSDPNASTFLTSLFTFELESFQDKLSVRLKEIPGIRRQDVFEEAFHTLEDIFTKIMKFEVKSEPVVGSRPLGEPDTKVSKKVETQDVHQQNDGMVTERNYTCVSTHPVWRFRKKSRKEVKLAFPETAFEFETKLSNVVVSHNYPSERIEFSCNVGLRKSKSCLEVILRQFDGQNTKHFIKEISQFLRCILPVWMNTFLLEKFTKPSTLLSIQSEPCSSQVDHNVVEVEESENGDTKEALSLSESETPLEDSNSSLETAVQPLEENCDQAVDER